MKYLLLTVIILIVSLPIAAQVAAPVQPDKNSDVFQMGDRTVRIPVPAGFTDVTGRIESDRHVFQRSDSDGENMTYVRDELVSLLQADPRILLGFHAKAWIPANRRTTWIGAKYFAQLISDMKSNYAKIIDPKGETMTKAKNMATAFATQNLGTKSTVDFNQITNLGFIQKSDHVFSAMALVYLQVNGQQSQVLMTLSFLRLNDRLVWIYCYVPSPTEKDFETIPVFTRTWTKAIIDANTKAAGPKKVINSIPKR